MSSEAVAGELPEGWCRIPFGRLLVDSQNGCSARSGKGTPTVVLRLADVSTSGVIADSRLREIPLSAEDRDKYALKPDDLLAIRVNGSPSIAGQVIRYPGPPGHAYCDHFIRFRVDTECALSSFAALAFKARLVREQVESQMVSSAGQNTVSQATYRQVELPLAPLAEQRRIVAKVETLLAEVDAARERLAKVPAILKRFRQSVLAAACSGRLTEEWREKHSPEALNAEGAEESLAPPSRRQTRRPGRLWGGGEVPELTDEERDSIPTTWKWCKVAELGDESTETVQIGPMSMKSAEFTDEGVRVLNVGCVQSGWIDDAKCNFLPPSRAADFARYRITTGDVLFTRSGTVGRCAVVGPKNEGNVITFHLLRVRPSPSKCLSEYIRSAFEGVPSIRRQTGEGQIGSTRAGFNTHLLASLDVPIPPLAEQHEIVRRVEALFKVADTIEKHVVAATAQADKLTQAVLAKAFRGELVPIEAELARQEGREYEPASVLLERVKHERPEAPTRRRKAGMSEVTDRLSRRTPSTRGGS